MDLAFSGTALDADMSSWSTPALENMSLAFADNSKFNRNLSGWDVRWVVAFDGAFLGASSFNFKSALDSSWKYQNSGYHDKSTMYAGTCSVDASCGRCGQKSVGGPAVVCPRLLSKADSTKCTRCADFGRECCTPYEFGDGNIHVVWEAWLDNSSAATDVYGPIEGWDVSGVTNMYALFCSYKDCGTKKGLAAGFDSDLSRWMSARYLICKAVSIHPSSAVSSSPSATFFRILTRVCSLLEVFYHAEKFDSDVSKWDVAIVTDMYYSKYSFLPSLSHRRRPPHSFQS